MRNCRLLANSGHAVESAAVAMLFSTLGWTRTTNNKSLKLTPILGSACLKSLHAMSGSLSVNEALDQLVLLNGKPVAIRGILRFDFEHIAIWHYPKAERRDAAPFGKASSSIWLSTGSGSVQLNERGLKELDGHRVSILGTLHAPDPRFGGCGHMSGTPAEIMVSSIDRL